MRSLTFVQPEGFYISASRINLYKQCEKCFYLKYILKTPAPYEDDTPYKYGTAVHDTVDKLMQGADVEYKPEDFNSEEDYQSYLSHKSLIREDIQSGEGEPTYFIPEIEFVHQIAGENVYGFLDGVVFDKDFMKELETWKFMPRAVELKDSKLTESGKILYRHGIDDKGERRTITSEQGKFGESKIVKMVEMKTQANKWSYNAIKTNYQFILYSIIGRELFNSPIFHLVNFYRKPSPGIQKERIRLDGNQEKMLVDVIKEIRYKIDHNNWNAESTCGYFSPYAEICHALKL